MELFITISIKLNALKCQKIPRSEKGFNYSLSCFGGIQYILGLPSSFYFTFFSIEELLNLPLNLF